MACLFSYSIAHVWRTMICHSVYHGSSTLKVN